jgi:hypothetical protein
MQRMVVRMRDEPPTSGTDAGSRRAFAPLPPVRLSLLQRLLGRLPRENAVVEINNLFAEVGVRAVTRSDVLRICDRHRTTLSGPLAGRFERIYRDYLTYCLADRHLSADELADLAHLQKLLGIRADAAATIHEHVARQLYRCSVSDALADGEIDPDESRFLGILQHELALSGRAAHRIIEAKMRQRRPPGPYA